MNAHTESVGNVATTEIQTECANLATSISRLTDNSSYCTIPSRLIPVSGSLVNYNLLSRYTITSVIAPSIEVISFRVVTYTICMHGRRGDSRRRESRETDSSGDLAIAFLVGLSNAIPIEYLFSGIAKCY